MRRFRSFFLVRSFLETLHGEKNMFKVFDFIRQAPDGFFLYLAHAYSRNDTRHSYYNLK